MKTRIKIDSAILSFIIILTGFLYQFSRLYTTGPLADDILDFLGVVVVLKGTFIRMAARGYKKAYSKSGQGLVITGPYTLVRNPMYLGSFLMGAGFVLIVWPWWSLPVFAWLFYLRFNKQIIAEEQYLGGLFGKDYTDYMKKVPRLFPKIKDVLKMKVKEVFPFEYVWSTKERWGLFAWPLLAVLLEGFQEKIVFGETDWIKNMAVVLLAIFLTGITKIWEYNRA